jgi:hypothetical protein
LRCFISWVTSKHIKHLNSLTQFQKKKKENEDAPSGDSVRICKEKINVHTTAYTYYWTNYESRLSIFWHVIEVDSCFGYSSLISTPLWLKKHSGNKMFKIKTTDLSTSWLQQEIKLWRSTSPQGRPSGCAGNCEVKKNKESKAETELMYG